MASQKVGLDYLTLDCHDDDKLKFLTAEFGQLGFAVWVRLLQRIYSDKGYYCDWNDDVALLFSDELKLGGNAVSEIVRCAVRRKLFDANMLDTYGILTSHGIQQRYIEATCRRKSVEIDARYALFDCTQNLPEYIKLVYVDIKGENVDILRQRNIPYRNLPESNVPYRNPPYSNAPEQTAGTAGAGVEKNEIPRLRDVLAYADKTGTDPDIATTYYNVMQRQGWCDRDGKRIENWKVHFSRWAISATARKKTEDAKEKAEREADDEMYKRLREMYVRETAEGGGTDEH